VVDEVKLHKLYASWCLQHRWTVCNIYTFLMHVRDVVSVGKKRAKITTMATYRGPGQDMSSRTEDVNVAIFPPVEICKQTFCQHYTGMERMEELLEQPAEFDIDKLPEMGINADPKL
jgi:hypothetical protein